MTRDDLARYRARANEVLQHQGNSLDDVRVRNQYACDLAHLVLLLVDEIDIDIPEKAEQHMGTISNGL